VCAVYTLLDYTLIWRLNASSYDTQV